jgi:spectinomycin phosphotransferase
MREKPDLSDDRIVYLLLDAYGLEIAQLEFLPFGSDYRSAVYRVETREPRFYFLKLRKGSFAEISVLVSRYLYERGVRPIIPPLRTKEGGLWARLEDNTCVLFPFIEGCDAIEKPLSVAQWFEFGRALKGIHTLPLPPNLRKRIPMENYTSRWRKMAKRFQALVDRNTFDEPLAAEMAAFMRDHREEIRFLIERARQLAVSLVSQPLERVLCHADIHAYNLLLTEEGAQYIVDWDYPVLAPKERDLMFIGGGVGGVWNTAREEALFFQGYGGTEANPIALSYYRYERIVQDIAAYGEQILLSFEGGSDREQGLQEFRSLFFPGSVVDIARIMDRG